MAGFSSTCVNGFPVSDNPVRQRDRKILISLLVLRRFQCSGAPVRNSPRVVTRARAGDPTSSRLSCGSHPLKSGFDSKNLSWRRQCLFANHCAVHTTLFMPTVSRPTTQPCRIAPPIWLSCNDGIGIAVAMHNAAILQIRARLRDHKATHNPHAMTRARGPI